MTDTTFRAGLRHVLITEMRKHPHVVVLGENVATWGGASAVTTGLIEEFGPQRVVETPVAENAIVGQALGAALGGLAVVLEVYSADFLFCAASEVVNDIAKWRFQHRWDGPLNLVLRMPMASSGIAAGPEHTQTIEGFLHRVPGLIVVIPSTVREAVGALRAAIWCGDPVVFLEHRRLYDLSETVAPSELDGYSRDLRRGSLARTGNDVTVVAWGWMRHLVMRAAEALEEEGGASVEVVDPVTIKPLDADLIADSVRKTGKLLVVEEAPATGSVGGEIIAQVLERAVTGPEQVARLTMPDLPNPFHPGIEASIIPDEASIRATIERIVGVPGGRGATLPPPSNA
jgi:acetoin:2,6-dichlorophenolindophenol oxidoreductase subunit beta